VLLCLATVAGHRVGAVSATAAANDTKALKALLIVTELADFAVLTAGLPRGAYVAALWSGAVG
jgi:hypothetical protein